MFATFNIQGIITLFLEVLVIKMEKTSSSEANVNGQVHRVNSAINTKSILKYKEDTKLYWENKMSTEMKDKVGTKVAVKKLEPKTESLIEKEIRIQKEKEKALEEERKNAIMLMETKSDTSLKGVVNSNDVDRVCKKKNHDLNGNMMIPAGAMVFNTTSNKTTQTYDSTKEFALNKKFSSMSSLYTNGNDYPSYNGMKYMATTSSTPFGFGNKKQLFGFKTQKGLMQKFIETHSKKTVAPVATQPPVQPIRPKLSFSDFEPAQSHNHPNWTKRPGYISTEDKIQKEMEEMRLRENELKTERAKLVRCSQPNLVTLGADKESDTDSGNESMGQLRSVSSNPNLLDEKECEPFTSPIQKKRNSLFEVWEKRVRNQND
ncbi:uncharacterized protein LOC106668937 isoform X2 [Cimex lectularius]|uniref:A-kinase anchor protein 2 C-terminal domain-containing protein n=2 Tax=Cimex lectularius TaxID=79782 RepID=A0A8I6S111_CIMLE|nr:uncharacterized protein LOC106668937 isoform X2 [Cimex lectularius]